MTEPFIDTPGVYELPAHVYHSDPVIGGSLSSSGARKLLPPSCPAIFKAWRDGEVDEHAEHFDYGRAAHLEVLGAGDPLVIVDAKDWRTNAAKEQRDAAYAAGKTPILVGQYGQVEAMAAELRLHPIASALLRPRSGWPERTLVWRDEPSGVWCRALVDWLRRPISGGRLHLVDYKTATDVDPDSIGKAIANYCYHGQGAWYSEGAEALGLSAGPPAFLLILQRKTSPFLVVVAQIHPDDIGRGHERNRKARDIYARCVERDQWPGYADDHVISVQMPPWAQGQHDGAAERGEFEPEGATL